MDTHARTLEADLKQLGHATNLMLVLSAVGLPLTTGQVLSVLSNRVYFLLLVFAFSTSILAAIASNVTRAMSLRLALRAARINEETISGAIQVSAAKLETWTYILFFAESAAFAVAVSVYALRKVW